MRPQPDVSRLRSGASALGRRRGDLLPLFVLVALLVCFTAASAAFLTQDNLFNVLRQTSVLLIVASGTTFIILQGSIDLSMGAVVTLTGITSAILLRDTDIGLLVIPAALLVGLLAGLVNGLTFAYLKVPSFLVTLGTQFALIGVGLLLSKGASVVIDNESVIVLASGTTIGEVPNIALWAVGVYLISIGIARYTIFGRYVYAIGGGERVAALSGVSVRRYKLLAFGLAGLLAGLGGLLLASRVQAGTPGMGDSLLLDSIAAVVIGGTALTGGIGGPARTLIGVLIIGILSNGLNILAVDPRLQLVIKGLIVIVAVVITTDRAKIGVIK